MIKDVEARNLCTKFDNLIFAPSWFLEECHKGIIDFIFVVKQPLEGKIARSQFSLQKFVKFQRK